MNIQIRPKKVFVALLCLIVFLLLANIAGILSTLYLGHDHVYGLIPLFNFTTERNIPTLYSSFALLFASILLLIIASTHKINGSAWLSWLGLSFIFLFLSVDEAVSIHERLNKPLRELLNASGLFYFAWIIPYGIALIVFVIAYSNFLRKLSRNIRFLFIVSGIIFITGAIGFETLGGRQVDLYGRDNLIYPFFYTCEEFLEMLGIVIFIYTLLKYITNQFGSLKITANHNDSKRDF